MLYSLYVKDYSLSKVLTVFIQIIMAKYLINFVLLITFFQGAVVSVIEVKE